MKLYGTTTSPFVRRVRIIAAAVGEPVELVPTAGDAGQATLRAVSPIRKVPVADVDGRRLFDSRVIGDWLIATRGWGELVPPRDPWRDANLINAIDGAVDSLVTLYTAGREGVVYADTKFERRQLDRVEAIFAWVADQLAPGRFGLAEVSVVCALDWMDFRKTYPTERATALAPVRAALADHPAIASTRPHE